MEDDGDDDDSEHTPMAPLAATPRDVRIVYTHGDRTVELDCKLSHETDDDGFASLSSSSAEDPAAARMTAANNVLKTQSF